MIRSLTYFLTVAKQCSITKASEELFISQPALSAAIIRLEEKLDVKLFDRSGRTLQLTRDGERLIPHATEICSAYEKMLNEICLMKSQSSTTLRFGSGLRHAVNIVDNFMYMYPSDNVTMTQYNSYYELKKALLNQEVDIALCAPPVDGVGISSQNMCTERLCAIFNENHPFTERKEVSFKELASSKLLALPNGFPLRVVVEELFQKVQVTPQYIMQAENNALTYLLHQSKSTDYVTIYPLSRCLELHNTYPDICFIPISGDPTRTIAASWLDSNQHTPQFEMMLKYIKEYYSDEKYSAGKYPKYYSASFRSNSSYLGAGLR